VVKKTIVAVDAELSMSRPEWISL